MTQYQFDAAPERAVSVSGWQDIVLLCDDGRGAASEYQPLLPLGLDVASRYPNGFGVLIVIPAEAVPPSDEARNTINQILLELQQHIRCMCWLIEGSGFQAAMARAVLTGMRFVSRAPYTRHVSVDLRHAVMWMLLQLDQGTGARQDAVETAVESVRSWRGSFRPSGTRLRS
jgi:hypothetical protein